MSLTESDLGGRLFLREEDCARRPRLHRRGLHQGQPLDGADLQQVPNSGWQLSVEPALPGLADLQAARPHLEMVFRSREEQSENTRSQHQGWAGWGYHRLLTFATNGSHLLIFIYLFLFLFQIHLEINYS